MKTASEKIAQWAVNVTYDTIPENIVYLAKRSILDLIGVTFAASKEQTTKAVERYLAESQNPQESTVIGLGIKTSCLEAAFANGTIGHTLDFDDMIQAVPGAGGPHQTAAIFPAALAIGEKLNKSGKDILTAYLTGFEVAYRVGRANEPDHYSLGWHNTETTGVFGATVAAGKLLDLSVEQMAHALGIAGSEACGLRENFGTMTKPYHAGQSNTKGIKAALLAKNGFTSSKTVFEGKYGFLNVLGKRVNLPELTDNLGQPFCFEDIRLKLHPCCGATQCSIDATLDLKDEVTFGAKDVESVNIQCIPLVYSVLVYHMPKTHLEGKFSVQFPVALAIKDKKVNLEQFNQETVEDPEIISLMQKIKLVCTPALFQEGDPGEPAIVEIKLKDGRTLTKKVHIQKGTRQNPAALEEILEKYRSCASTVLSKAKIEKSIDLVMNLEKVDNINKVIDIIRGKNTGRKSDNPRA
jgi:2-methylcitrate dehydratase PrpD